MESNLRTPLPSGLELEGYSVRDHIGSDQFGLVYRATEFDSGDLVALKEYMPLGWTARENDELRVKPIAPSKSVTASFERGRETFRAKAEAFVGIYRSPYDEPLRHRCLVPMRHQFTANGTAYLVMELDHADGPTLSDIVTRGGTLARDKITEYFFLRLLLDCIEEIHALGLLHCDIRPANIIVLGDGEGEPILLEFGSERIDASQASSTTAAPFEAWAYAPEQWSEDQALGPWTDIYAMGATLYHLVTGTTPPTSYQRLAEENQNHQSHILAAEAAGTMYDPSLLQGIDWAMSLNPQSRPESVEAWRKVIEIPAPIESDALNVEPIYPDDYDNDDVIYVPVDEAGFWLRLRYRITDTLREIGDALRRNFLWLSFALGAISMSVALLSGAEGLGSNTLYVLLIGMGFFWFFMFGMSLLMKFLKDQ